MDSRRWRDFQPRSDDIVIATYPKCGTTWMQQIVALLVFQDTRPRPVMDLSIWLDRRFGEPVEVALERIEAQAHRRFLKSHLPADGLPLHDDVRYIHVARDGRDEAMSYHNHQLGLKPEAIARLSNAGLQDETIARPYPEPLATPAEHFHRWVTEGAAADDSDGLPFVSFFRCEQSWWDVRSRPNVLLVHYNDLLSDLQGEMQRVAGFLGIEVPPSRWPEFVEAAGFDAMRRNGDALMGGSAALFDRGGAGFFHRGGNGHWRGVFAEEDLARYDALVAARLTPDCGRWLADGRRITDPGQGSGSVTPAGR